MGITSMKPTNAHKRRETNILVVYTFHKLQKNTIKSISTAETIM